MSITLSHHETYISHLSEEPHECPQCHTMRYVWVNRAGRSTCLYCDERPDPYEHLERV